MGEQLFTIESERINATYSVRILKDDEIIFEISNWNSLSEMHKAECEDIVALLNELSDKNRQLKKENEQLKQKVDFYKYFQKDARELEKENENLRQELQRKDDTDE